MPKENTTRPAPDTNADPSALAAAQAENATLKARITELESAKTRIDADESQIREKMAKGLRREQAGAVIQRQREFEARKQQQNKK